VWGDTSQNKLCVYGGLPYSVKGDRDFLVPVQIWMTSQYPLEPPTIYVVPLEREQIVSNHRFVDVTGLVYTPALSAWSPVKSSLKETIFQLIKLFCLQAPLWIDDTPSATAGPVPSSTSPGRPRSANTQSEFGEAGKQGEERGDSAEPDEESMCVICLSVEKNTVLVPCGHYCCCQGCASNVNACPVCRKPIQFRQKVFV
jgi:hypothetical protein